MRDAAIARVYAAALLELARDKGETDALLADLRDLKAALDAAPDLLRLLVSPELGRERQERIIARVLEGARSTLTPRFLLVLVTKRRGGTLPSIIEMSERLRDEELRRRRGRVLSARPLSDAERRALEAAVGRATGAEVVLQADTDPSLMAGMVLQLEDKIVDGSLKTRLARLRERLLAAELGKE